MNPRTKKFLSYYRPYLGRFSVLMACSLAGAGISLAFPLCTRRLAKTVLEGGLPDPFRRILMMAVLMLALAAVRIFCGYYADARGHALGACMEGDLRGELFGHLMKLPFRFYDDQKTGQLMSRLTNDLLLLSEMYHHVPEDLVVSIIRFAGAFVILSSINGKLTIAVFLLLPALVAYSLYFNRKMNQALYRNKQRVGDINAQAEESLSGIRVVKSFANEELEKEKFRKANRRFLDARKEGYKSEALFYGGVDAFSQIITIIAVIVGGICIVRGTLDLPDLMTFLLYIGNFVEPVRSLVHVAGQVQEGVTGFQRFMEILEIEPEADPLPSAARPERVQGNIEFRDVGFRYQENGQNVLKHISFSVKKGDYTAIVGTSGAGKTTLCSLIPRFYEAREGQILLDGQDIREFALADLRRNIGVVQQDVQLFSGTVLENIRYGKPGATLEEVVEAAKRANAHDFICGLPEGYETEIGQRGIKLSGGQKQRLSIARVFLKDPPVLIFDEATSSLDNESERAVQESLESLLDNRTTFVIAHRLTTIRNAGKILVLTRKGIDEQGTHDELLRQNGVYTRLYQTQLTRTAQ